MANLTARVYPDLTAQAHVLFDQFGNPISSTNPQPVQVMNVPSWTQIFQTTQTNVTTWVGSGDLAVGAYGILSVNINLSAFTGTNIIFKVARKDAFGNLYTLATGATLTAAGTQIFSVGPGLTTVHALGPLIQIIATLTAVTGATFTVDVEAR